MASETPVHTCCGQAMRAYRTSAKHRMYLEGLEFTVICGNCGRWYDTYPSSTGQNGPRERPTFRRLYVPGQDERAGRPVDVIDSDGVILDATALRPTMPRLQLRACPEETNPEVAEVVAC